LVAQPFGTRRTNFPHRALRKLTHSFTFAKEHGRIITAAVVTSGKKHDGKQLKDLVVKSKQTGIEVSDVIIKPSSHTTLNTRSLFPSRDSTKGVTEAISVMLNCEVLLISMVSFLITVSRVVNSCFFNSTISGIDSIIASQFFRSAKSVVILILFKNS